MEQSIARVRHLVGEVTVPGELAAAEQHVLLGAVAQGASRIANTPAGIGPLVGVLRQLGVHIEPPLMLDKHLEIKLSRREAERGGEKEIKYKRNGRRKKLLVKIPAGIKSGTKIRLRGMGDRKDKRSGDLYLHVKIKS